MSARMYLGRDEDGNTVAHIAGIEMPPAKVVQALPGAEPPVIVIKVPGHSYWSGRGSQGYAPVSYEVYEVVGVAEGTALFVEKLIGFDAKGLELWDRINAIAWPKREES